MIYGNKEGIRDSLLAQMEALYDLDLSAEVFAPRSCSTYWRLSPARSTARSVSISRAAARCWTSPSAD